MANKLIEATKIGTRKQGWCTSDIYQLLHIFTHNSRALLSTPVSLGLLKNIKRGWRVGNLYIGLIHKIQIIN